MSERAPAVVHRYVDRGAGGFANLILPSGERVFLSLAPSGLRVHHLILWGRVPGRTLHTAGADEVTRMVRVITRDVARLPKLPANAELQSFMAIATAAINDPCVYARHPARDEEGEAMTTLQILTRAALGEVDAAGVVRRLQRASATP